MKAEKSLSHHLGTISAATLTVLLLAGCQSTPQKTASQPAPAPTALSAAPAAPVAAVPAAPVPDKIALPIRIKAGSTEGFTDKAGNRWLPDQGFTEGDTMDRTDMAITNATDPRIYQAERYSMTGFTQPLPNGKYIVKLHFCETYDGITGPGQRVFSFNVAGHEFKDFDVWVKAGGSQRAYIETVPVEITDGKLQITFTPNVENPQINGIEILPAP